MCSLAASSSSSSASSPTAVSGDGYSSSSYSTPSAPLGYSTPTGRRAPVNYSRHRASSEPTSSTPIARPRFLSFSCLDECPSPHGSPNFDNAPSPRTLPMPPKDWITPKSSLVRSRPVPLSSYSSSLAGSTLSLASTTDSEASAIFAKLDL